VEGTTVPEASVDKYRDPSTGEHDVSAKPKARDWGTIDPVPEAQSVQGAPKLHFWKCVALPLILHPPK
jgi:hypothetical protein